MLIVTADANEGRTMALLLGSLGNPSVYVGAVEALHMLEGSVANLIVTQQDMVDMSCIEFTASVRELAAETGNFSDVLVSSSCRPRQGAESCLAVPQTN